MPRLARVVARNYPHHVTQRGNYRQPVFLEKGDYNTYLEWLKLYCEKYSLAIWAYCLMQNHVHFVCVPRKDDSMARTFNLLHMRYAQYVNRRQNISGHLWQGRFYSSILDERHVYAAVRYVENNPVRIQMVPHAEEYRWSSARAHVESAPDGIISSCYLEDEITSWKKYLRERENPALVETIKKNMLTGRPCGDVGFVKKLERRFGRRLQALPHGRPRKSLGK